MFWRKKKTSTPPKTVTDPVYVVTFGSYTVVFTDPELAEQAITEWRAIYPEGDEFWAAVGPVIGERSQQPTPFVPFDRVPHKAFIYRRMAAFRADGQEHEVVAPLAAGSMWTFEFMEGYTTKPSQDRVEVRPGRGVYVEASARGTDEAAVAEAFERARVEARATARRLSSAGN